jgi:hypothetical protein
MDNQGNSNLGCLKIGLREAIRHVEALEHGEDAPRLEANSSQGSFAVG